MSQHTRMLRLLPWLSWPFGLAAVLLVALVFRLMYLALLGDFIGADEAVGALMALEIASGQDFPLLIWEAHYAGTLTSYLGAPLFWLFDPNPWTFRLTTLPLVLVGIAAIAVTARNLWGHGSGLAAGAWLALGPPLLFAQSSQAIGGYPEVLCFGGLTLWVGARLGRRPMGEAGAAWEWALFGAAGGFGTYSMTFVFPIFLGTVWVLGRHRGGLGRREWGWMASGFLVGLSPFIFYNFVHDGASVLRLGGRVFDVSRAELAHAPSLLALAVHKGIRYLLRLLQFPSTALWNFAVFLGLPPWGAWGTSALIVGGILLTRRQRSPVSGGVRDNAAGNFGLALLGWCGLATFLFIWISGLDRPRHLFPFYLLTALTLAALWRCSQRWRVLALSALVAILLGNVVATTHDARGVTPRVARLAEALRGHDVGFVYTDYSIAYPLIFLSRGSILASPAAGPVNVERRPAYTEAVVASAHPAYVFRRNTEASTVFVREMRRNGHPFLHEALDEFDIYLPEGHIHPEELALLRRFSG